VSLRSAGLCLHRKGRPGSGSKGAKAGVPEMVDEDMYILAGAAVSATKHWAGAQQYDLVGIVQEISDTIKTEMDYIQEGHNAEYFAWFFKDDKTIHIPTIFWSLRPAGNHDGADSRDRGAGYSST